MTRSLGIGSRISRPPSRAEVVPDVTSSPTTSTTADRDPLAIARRQPACRQAVSLAEQYIARMAEREPTVRAWAWFDPDAVRAAARERDLTPPRSYLHGLPIGIKDVIDTADMPTAYGSPIYRDHRPRSDAACVALLRRAGAVLMGKTATAEFAALAPASTVNPHDAARTPGGSSSGSAAAVADGMVWAALGTQTAGSIIRPAAFCGCVGYKPSFGTINRAGLKPLSETTDTLGVFTRRVVDAGWLVAKLAARPELCVTEGPSRPPRLALCRTPYADQAEPAAHAALELAARRAARAGAEIVDYRLPSACEGLNEAGRVILISEAQHALAPELSVAGDKVSALLRELLGDERVDRVAYDEAQASARRGREAIADAFTRCDALLSFSCTGEAPRGLASTGNPTFNHLWTLLRLPCINVPGISGPSGLPIGVQLIGARGDDARLLQIAAWLQTTLS